MASADTTRQLLRHAGVGATQGASAPSIASCTSPGSDSEDYLDDALADFLRALSKLNHELNGAVPSERAAQLPAIPRDVAYAVIEVTRMLRGYAEAQGDSGRGEAARRAAGLVDSAWSGVLAGNIDDLSGHVRR